MQFNLIFAICFFVINCITTSYVLFLLKQARDSVVWPTIDAGISYCKVTVSTGTDNINNNWSLNLVYTFTVNNIEFRGRRYYFGSTLMGISTKRMIELEKKYENEEKIIIAYKPTDPKISTIEVGIHKNLQVGSLIVFFLFLLSLYLLILNL